jgi:hypothetical protein
VCSSSFGSGGIAQFVNFTQELATQHYAILENVSSGNYELVVGCVTSEGGSTQVSYPILVSVDENIIVPVTLAYTSQVGQLEVTSELTPVGDLFYDGTEYQLQYIVSEIRPRIPAYSDGTVALSLGTLIGTFTFGNKDYDVFGFLVYNFAQNSGVANGISYSWNQRQEYIYTNYILSQIDTYLVDPSSEKRISSILGRESYYSYFDLAHSSYILANIFEGDNVVVQSFVPPQRRVGPLAQSPATVIATMSAQNDSYPSLINLRGTQQGATYDFNISVNQQSLSGLHNVSGRMILPFGISSQQISSRNVTLTHVSDCYFFADGRTLCESRNAIPAGYDSVVNFTFDPAIGGKVNTSAPGNFSVAWVVPVWSGNLPRAN